jgi:hypothetical protein
LFKNKIILNLWHFLATKKVGQQIFFFILGRIRIRQNDADPARSRSGFWSTTLGKTPLLHFCLINIKRKDPMGFPLEVTFSFAVRESCDAQWWLVFLFSITNRSYIQHDGHNDRLHNMCTIERLDQGHLYPNLEVPGLTCPGRESNPGFPRGKEPSRQLICWLFGTSTWAEAGCTTRPLQYIYTRFYND